MPMILGGSGTITGATVFSNNAVFLGTVGVAGAVNTSSTLSVAGTANVTQGLSTASRGINKTSVPSGSVLQVVNTVKTDAFGTSSGSWVDVTGLSVSITPIFSTSKVLVMVNCPGGRTGTGGDAFVRLLRDGTLVGNGNGGFFSQYAGQYGLDPTPGSRIYLDSPATTSSVTYKVQTFTGGDTIYLGARRLNDYIFGTDITVMEIAQ